MFNLIVAVISIALIAGMAAASIYYGGDGFSSSSARAQAATLITQGQQIAAAADLYRIQNSDTSITSGGDCGVGGNFEDCAINRLVSGGYLQAIPTFPARLAIQPDGISAFENAFGAPPGFFSWMNRWTISDDGDVVRIFLSEDNAVGICEAVEDEGAEPVAPWNLALLPVDNVGIGTLLLDNTDIAPFRCIEGTDFSGEELGLIFAYRIHSPD